MAGELTNEIDISTLTGLSEQEAAQKLKEEGYNELPTAKPRTALSIGLDVVKEPMFLMLIASGLIYLLLGDVQEALILLSFVFVIIGITFYQERKTERALEALRDLSSPRALVIRGGQQKRIAGREVVTGDIVLLSEGDRVPADAVLLWAMNVTADESLLTGESVPVRKVSWDNGMEASRPGGDDLPFVYSGTLLVKGQGVARVTATGLRTEIGKIGKALTGVEIEQTPLQKETGRLVRQVAIVAGVLFALVVVLYGLTRGNWLDGLLAGITLAMAMLPEEFPVVLTIFLALGAWRIAQKRVLTRRVPAIETLGSATVLCVDKTGTLTMNRMSVSQALSRTARSMRRPISRRRARYRKHSTRWSSSVSWPAIVTRSIRWKLPSRSSATGISPGRNTFMRDWALLREYPLSQKLLALSHVWRSPEGGDYVIAAKGAPEAIADLCHFSERQKQDLMLTIGTMANEGLRILGMAKATFTGDALPGEQHDFDFTFLGLVGLSDPVRPTVPAALKECYTAGLRVVMITGDYPGTAQSIARQIGLKPRDEVITGPELDAMSDETLQQRIRRVNIFARVVPEQKLRLVMALKANGEIVAMTGDGVNDAPALKAAHIGIAMGGRGTDVAREAAALVLLDDDFSSIVEAVKLGRRIFDNLRKAMAYIFAIHVPIAGLSLFPVVFNWPLILLPVHVVFLEMIIDPSCSVVFESEPEEADVMDRPPRNPKEPLFSRRMLTLSLLQGASVLVAVLAVFVVARQQGLGELETRTLTFATLIVANLSLILTNRSWSRTIVGMFRSPNKTAQLGVGGRPGVSRSDDLRAVPA